MMSYYKPTNLFQKLIKLLQLYFYFLRLTFIRKATVRKPRNTSILMVVSKLDRTGGLERQALELSSALVQHGCLITIVTDRIDDSAALELRSGFLIRRLNGTNRPVRLFLSMVWFLFQKRGAFQIVHAHGVTGFTLIAITLCKFLRRPVLLKGATMGDFAGIFRQNDFKHRVYQNSIRSANRVVAISRDLQQELLSCGISETRIVSIPNVVHVEKFAPPSATRKTSLRKAFTISEDQLVFLYLGRLEARKAINVLLKAWHLKSPGILIIVGSGPEREKWKQITADWNLKGVRFYDESKSPLDFYHCADVFVLPSVKEGMPGALLEAMSCGLPCIATKIGGVVDVMEDEKQGLLVPPGSDQELAEALEYTALHPEKRNAWGKSARETILRQFEVSRISETYNALYQDLLIHRL